MILLAAAAGPAVAQRPERAAYQPEAQVMGYYAAVMHFSPIGLGDPAVRWAAGAEVTYLPNLTADQQKVGFGGRKAEDTNFCPVFPRLRASLNVESWEVDVAYLPSLRVCGVKPHMVSASLARRFELAPDWGGVLRASGHYGVLDAAITCSKEAIADSSNNECFGGQESNDRFRPVTLAIEGALTYGGWLGRGLEPYVLVGVRREDLRFDVNFVRADGSLDDTRLTTSFTRAHVAAGAAWAATTRLRFGGEIYYAPRALLTARTRASWALSGR